MPPITIQCKNTKVHDRKYINQSFELSVHRLTGSYRMEDEQTSIS